jgi:hypothetical protein
MQQQGKRVRNRQTDKASEKHESENRQADTATGNQEENTYKQMKRQRTRERKQTNFT